MDNPVSGGGRFEQGGAASERQHMTHHPLTGKPAYHSATPELL
jgi:hypothetical protein